MAQTVKRLPAMRETQVHFLAREDPLEKEMAIHSSAPAWKIPWMEEPDRFQSMGSQRIRYNWATSLSLTYLFASTTADLFICFTTTCLLLSCLLCWVFIVFLTASWCHALCLFALLWEISLYNAFQSCRSKCHLHHQPALDPSAPDANISFLLDTSPPGCFLGISHLTYHIWNRLFYFHPSSPSYLLFL